MPWKIGQTEESGFGSDAELAKNLFYLAITVISCLIVVLPLIIEIIKPYIVKYFPLVNLVFIASALLTLVLGLRRVKKNDYIKSFFIFFLGSAYLILLGLSILEIVFFYMKV